MKIFACSTIKHDPDLDHESHSEVTLTLTLTLNLTLTFSGLRRGGRSLPLQQHDGHDREGQKQPPHVQQRNPRPPPKQGREGG